MNNEQKLIDLETKFLHQDASIEELKEVVHHQYIAIEALEKSVRFLLTRLKEGGDKSLVTSHEKPPHY